MERIPRLQNAKTMMQGRELDGENKQSRYYHRNKLSRHRQYHCPNLFSRFSASLSQRMSPPAPTLVLLILVITAQTMEVAAQRSTVDVGPNPAALTSCGTKFTDASSSAVLADVVVQGVVRSLRQATSLVAHLYTAEVAVSRIYKGAGMMGVAEEGTASSNATIFTPGRGRIVEVGQFAADEDRQSCVASVLEGNTYLFFLTPRQGGLDGGEGRAANAAPRAGDDEDALPMIHTALPREVEPKALRAVKKVVCPTCTSAPVIKRVRCRHCATPPKMKRKMTKKMSSDDTRTLKAGKKLSLRCVARGTPRPSYTWLKDGRLLHRSRGQGLGQGQGQGQGQGRSNGPEVYRSGSLLVRHMRTYSLLVVKDVGPEDAGTYRCLALNAIGEAAQSVRVVVEGSRPTTDAPDLDIERTTTLTPTENPRDTREEEGFPTPPNDPEPTRGASLPDHHGSSSGSGPGVRSGSRTIRDPCASSPCYNGGMCSRDFVYPKRARCDCTPQFFGRNCQFRRRTPVEGEGRNEDEIEDENEGEDGTQGVNDIDESNTDSSSLSSSSSSSSSTTASQSLSPSPPSSSPPSPAPQTSEDNSSGSLPPRLSKKKRKKASPARGGYGAGDALVKETKSAAPQLKLSPCPDAGYCHNGGTCMVVVKIDRKFCTCARGFGGRRCERGV